MLAASAGNVVLRDDLLDEHSSDESLTRAISILRKGLKKVTDDKQKYIETIPKREKQSDEDSEKDKENQQKAIKNLNTSNLRMQEMMKKVGKAVSKRVKTAPNQLLLGNGNISILTEADTKYDFYLDLQEEIINSGVNTCEKNFVVYPRLEVYKLIYKWVGMEKFLYPAAKK